MNKMKRRPEILTYRSSAFSNSRVQVPHSQRRPVSSALAADECDMRLAADCRAASPLPTAAVVVVVVVVGFAMVFRTGAVLVIE